MTTNCDFYVTNSPDAKNTIDLSDELNFDPDALGRKVLQISILKINIGIKNVNLHKACRFSFPKKMNIATEYV